jgi:hypothetical protein
MQHGQRFASMTLALVIAAVLVAFSSPLTSTAHAGEKDKKKDVTLTLTLGLTGIPYIKVQPRDAKIWRNKPDKPKKVNWIAVNNSPYSEVFWEIRYAPSKGGESANYFGDVDIECGQTEIKVQPDKKPDFPKAEWPYSVTAYGCADGQKAQRLAELDPRIIWND